MRGTRIGDKSLALGLLALMWWRNISRLHSFPQFSLSNTKTKSLVAQGNCITLEMHEFVMFVLFLARFFLTLLINLHDVQTTRFLHDFKRHCNSFYQTSFSYVRNWQGIYRFQQEQIITNDVLRNKFLDLFSYVKRDLKKQSNVFLFCCVNYPCNILRRPAPTPYM